ncbi:cytochrome P450 [Nannocystis bainbridge]|uniref:Cytochrome P450 n=1 Tax=Nannocystis bainbridge TaxID=2995303 RepID=A0ABT5DTW6_9BACT|nr:cytochrome P450 [Nannocystis bainbridge]MDC0715846.1 cytochrome P450 [Nannocystis bainbridge]
MTDDARVSPSPASEAERLAVGDLFQPFSPVYQEDPARSFYAEAHARAPVAYSKAFFAYLVTSHAEVMHVLRDPGLFSSARLLEPVVPFTPELLARLQQGTFPLPPGLFNNDPPSHTRARLLFSKAFTPNRVAEMEPQIRRFAGELAAELASGQGELEMMRDFTFKLPMRVIAALVGVPYEDMPQLKLWQDDWFKLYDPALDEAAKLTAADGFLAYQRYYADLIAERRAKPADDLISALLRAREGEDALSTEELISHLVVLLFAGYETSASLMGSLLFALLGEPSLWQRVGEDAALLQAAIEETLRMHASVQMEPRHTTRATSVGGVEIPAGATVMTFFGAANYDPRVFPDPLRFDLTRPNGARHLGFGWGVHSCLGASLARLEVRAAIQALRAALPNLRLAEGARRSYLPSLFFRTPAAVPAVRG